MALLRSQTIAGCTYVFVLRTKINQAPNTTAPLIRPSPQLLFQRQWVTAFAGRCPQPRQEIFADRQKHMLPRQRSDAAVRRYYSLRIFAFLVRSCSFHRKKRERMNIHIICIMNKHAFIINCPLPVRQDNFFTFIQCFLGIILKNSAHIMNLL